MGGFHNVFATLREERLMQQGSFIQLDLRWLAHTSLALLNIPPYRCLFIPFIIKVTALYFGI